MFQNISDPEPNNDSFSEKEKEINFQSQEYNDLKIIKSLLKHPFAIKNEHIFSQSLGVEAIERISEP